MLAYEGEPDPPIEPVYPLEKLLGLLAGGGLARALGKEALRRAAGGTAPSGKPSITERPNNVPKDWIQSPSRNEKGVRYRDPNNQHNEVRVQEGNPNSKYPNSQEPYVRWKQDGQWLDKYGKSSTDPEKTHIPLDEFNFNLDIFK